jgi:hypothetical protein
VTHAVHANVERNAINDAMFAQHLRKTHSKIQSAPLPQHTIVIKASKLKCKRKGKKLEHVDVNAPTAKDLLHELR